MEEPVLSMKFYENDIIVSYKCIIIDEDNIKIGIYHNDKETDNIILCESELRNIINIIKDDEFSHIKGSKIKKSFIKNLEVLLD